MEDFKKQYELDNRQDRQVTMSYIVSRTDKAPTAIFAKWLFSDLNFITNNLPHLSINFDRDYFILTSGDFQKIADQDVQIIWGALLAVPKNEEIQVDEQDLPMVEGNNNIWRNGHMQLDNAEIEIDCFDSSYTIMKFKSEEMSRAFKDYFSEAIELEKFIGTLDGC